MELMQVCCKWIIYLGTLFATAATAAVVRVKVGEPVTLYCTINKNDVNVASADIEWKTEDQTVAKFSNGEFIPGHGFKDRVWMSRKNIEIGNISLTITHTVMCDYVQFECYYNKKYQRSWELQVIADIPKELTVTVGQPTLIPCYERLNKCTGDMHLISFEWLKENERVFHMVKGGRESKGRAEVSANEIKNGNFSLFFQTAYFSDKGTYRCNGKTETVLKLNDYRKEIKVSMKDFLSLHLYTVDPVEVFFQREDSSKKDLLCRNNQCTKNWKYIDRAKTIELEGVMREHLGTYTVKDGVRGQIYCTYIVTSESNNLVGMRNTSIFIMLAYFVCLRLIID